MGEKKIIVFFVSGLLLLGLIFIPGYLRLRSLAEENRALEKKIEEIKEANLRLKEEQQRLKEDPLYLEEVARKKLGVVREGEELYRVVPLPESE